MLSYTSHLHTRTQTRPGMPECPPLPACPACGQIECLCRPRFFAGQVLTEDDLNRLSKYFIQKNKLHNRYVHGWGVVCGLEVLCHACPNIVSVRTGYALSPCGDDIIVCEDETVDVCALIQRCRTAPKHPECEPPRDRPDTNCQELIEDWVLTICYDEKPSRGITALRGGSGTACCTKCSCGGSSSCGCGGKGGCGCGGKGGSSCKCQSNGNGHSHNGGKRVPPQCEPTLVCETYGFNVYKVPPGDPQKDRRDLGELLEEIFECFEGYMTALPPMPSTDASKEDLEVWCCSVKETLIQFFTDYPVYDCGLLDRLRGILCPPASGFDNATAYRQALAPLVAQVASLLAEYFRFCFCSALLPPCPPPTDCNCVPLATIKVRKRDCKILGICNLGPRKFVVTFPHIGYWLSFSQVLSNLRKRIELFCCLPFQQRDSQFNLERPPLSLNLMARRSLRGTAMFNEKLSESYAHRSRNLDPQSLAMASLGLGDAAGNPLLSMDDMEDPISRVFMDQLVRPVFEGALPPELSGLIETVAARRTDTGVERAVMSRRSAAAGPGLEDVAALRTEMADMRRRLDDQAIEIDRLRGTPG